MKVLFAGRLEAVKNPIMFVKAGIQLSDHEFIVAGDGSLRKRCKMLAQGKKNIVFLGWVDGETVKRLMIEADVFCQLDSVENIWSSSLVAAMKNKKAVICTNTGYTSKYLKNNCHAILISPQEDSQLVGAIERLSKDIRLRQMLGENAQILVNENLSTEKIVKQIQDLIANTVRSRRERQDKVIGQNKKENNTG
jgi:glycosyltransferase involved in cell wall biosynthesis